MRRLTLLLATAALVALALAPSAQAAAEPNCAFEPALCYGIAASEASLSTHRAGAHPDLTVGFQIKQDPESKPTAFGFRKPYAATRDVVTELPPGLVGDPNILGPSQQCTVEQYLTPGENSWGELRNNSCPGGSQVGTGTADLYNSGLSFCGPVYMMRPPGGDIVARLAFTPGGSHFFINFEVRSEGDYGLTATVNGALSNVELADGGVTVWGVPDAPSHDTERGETGSLGEGGCESPPHPPGGAPLPFMTNPTSCGPAKAVSFWADSWLAPGLFSESRAPLEPITGCDKVPFNPYMTAEPTSHRTASPTGMDMTIHLPASGEKTLEPSQMRDIRIDLPPGIALNPGSADGLGVCSAEEVRFGKREDAHCPQSSKLASTEFEVTGLERRLKGAIYLRQPEPGHLVRVWVVADDLGAHVKLPGEVELDPVTGQLHSVLLDSPQFGVREVKLFFKSGFRAPFANPSACGSFQTHYEFTAWSGHPPISGDTPMKIDEGCDTGGFDPKLAAGTTNPQAGSYSPFVFDLIREDGEQNPAALDITLPPGLAANFSGIPLCEGAATETGACPPASRIGKVIVASGYGPAPLWVPQPGKRPTAVYLAGPYKGAPLSVIAVVPAQAGPYDLGDQVVRSAIYVDPTTAQGSVKSDPLPQIIQGIPIPYRHVIVELDREPFTLNPTSCAPMAVASTIRSAEGKTASPSARFQVGGCRELGFQPKLSLKLKGGTRRGSHPALAAVLRARPGDANIAAAQVTLPHSEFLDQGHIRTVCTRVQFAAKECPAASIYGYAVAKTPLFDTPLEGPVYLRSSSHLLPDLVAALKGPASQPVEVDLDGRVDSIHGGIRNSFEVVPDAPVSEFTLSMQGGRKGLLINSENLCAKTNRATARFTAQNGKAITLHPALQSACGKHPRKHSTKHHGGKRHRHGG